MRDQGDSRRGGAAHLLAAALHAPYDLAQPFEREQRRGLPWRGSRWCARIIGGTHGECCMGSIGELDDQVWINTVSDPDSLDPLAAQRVMGMGDCDEFRRCLG